jgi:hypothetical protein
MRWRCEARHTFLLDRRIVSEVRVTSYPNVDRLLGSLLNRMRRILGQNLVGLYLYGSLVTGDFDPEISDVDLLAVVSSDIDDAQFERLRTMHDDLEARNPAWKGRVEVQYVSTHALQTCKTESSQIAAISPGEPFHLKEAGREWLINWYIVRERGRALYGMDPKMHIPPITKQEYLQVIREHARMWLEWAGPGDQYAQSYAILTMCRALYATQHGEQVSKREAACWVQDQFPEWAWLTRKALAWRRGEQHQESEQQVTYSQAARFIRFAADRILGG